MPLPLAADKDRAVLAGVYLSDNNDSGTTIQAPDGHTLDLSKPLPPTPWGRPGGASRVPVPLNFPSERPDARSQNGSRSQPSLYPLFRHREARRSLSRESARTQPYDGPRTHSRTVDGCEVEHKEPHVFPTELPPRPPSRTRQAMRSSMRSISALSILPGDMLYPPPALHHPSGNEALRTLGLNDRRQAPAVFELQMVAEEGRIRPSSSSRTLVETPRISTTNAGVVPPTEAAESSKVGRMAWAHALMGFFVIFNIWGMNNAFGVFQSYYAHVLLPGTSPATIAWIGSFQLFLVFGLGTPIGRAVDAGHFRVFFNVGSALLVVFVFATSWCATWWQLFLVQGVLTGAAMGMVFCSGLVVLMSYFDERNIGLALGLGAAGSSLGGIAYAVLAQRLLPTHGFARTIRITGCLCLGTMVAPNLVFRQRPELRARARERVAGKFQLLDWNVFKEGSYLLMAAGLFFAFWGVYFGFVYMISYGTDILHLGPTTAINLLIAMNACNLPGRFLPALISDRCIGPLNTLIPACLLSSMFIWMWVGTTTHSALLVVACFYGFACAGTQVLYASTVHSFCLGAKNQERRGVRAGMVFSVVGVACLTGTPIGGALIKYRMDRGLANPYLGAQCFAGVSLLMGGLLLLASRVVKEGWAAKRA